MTDAFPTSPTDAPPDERIPPPPRLAQARREVTETVERIMGEGAVTTRSPSGDPQDRPDDRARSGRPEDADGPPIASTATDVARDEAAQVADTAKQAGAQVAGTVKEQAAQVTAEAGQQAKQLLSQARSELSDQAAATQRRVADGLRALAHELVTMTEHSEQPGPATDLARQAAGKAQQAAGWLADRDPGTLLDDVRSFARRRPGAYLAVALGAGILAGRLTRGLTAPAPAVGGGPRDRQGGIDPGVAAGWSGTPSSTPTDDRPHVPSPSGPGFPDARSDPRGGVSR